MIFEKAEKAQFGFRNANVSKVIDIFAEQSTYIINF